MTTTTQLKLPEKSSNNCKRIKSIINTFYKLVALFFTVVYAQICCAQIIPGDIKQPATTHKNNKPIAVTKENIVESAADIKPFSEGVAVAKLNDGSWCIINKYGH